VSIVGGFDDPANGVHVELNSPAISFPTGGTTLDCAARIIDTIRCALNQNAAFPVEAMVMQLPDGSVKITFKIPNGSIETGFVTVCVRAQPVVTGVTPNSGTTGDMVTIAGGNFGNNPDNICVVLVDGQRFIPLQAVSASDTQIRAVLGVVPNDLAAPTHPLPIMVGLGHGNVGRFQPAFDNIILDDPVWVWHGDAPGAVGGAFTPQPPPPPANQVWLHGVVNDGVICIFLDGKWRPDTMISIVARAHTSCGQGGSDLSGPTIRFLGGGSTLDCAYRIADVLRCAFKQQAGVMVIVEVTPLADGRVKITVKVPDCKIDRGMLTICVKPPPAP
jgi:hypothetical protein